MDLLMGEKSEGWPDFREGCFLVVRAISPPVLSASRNVSRVKPKFHYADFHRNFPARKVVDTNHESRRYKPSRHIGDVIEFGL